MSLLNKISRLARSPQGRRMSEQAMSYARSPAGKRKIAQARERLAGRRSSRPR